MNMSTMFGVCLLDGHQNTHEAIICFEHYTPEGKILPGGRPPRLATGRLYRRGLQPAGATVGGVEHVAAGRLQSGARARGRGGSRSCFLHVSSLPLLITRLPRSSKASSDKWSVLPLSMPWTYAYLNPVTRYMSPRERGQ